MSLGAFQLLDLGDATVGLQLELACPVNKLGNVDIYQVPHHGNGVAPQLTWALEPTVAVINNGPRKGGSGEGFQVVADSPRLEDTWQSQCCCSATSRAWTRNVRLRGGPAIR